MYSFDGFVVDKDRLEMRSDGQPVTMEPQVFSLLIHLLENRDRVISKDELIASVWNGRIVSDATLNSRNKCPAAGGRRQREAAAGHQDLSKTRVPLRGPSSMRAIPWKARQCRTCANDPPLRCCRSTISPKARTRPTLPAASPRN